MRMLTVTAMACALFSGATLADNTQTSSTEDMPSATIELSGGAVAAGIGFQWGHGDVVYEGQKHRFSVSGLSIVTLFDLSTILPPKAHTTQWHHALASPVAWPETSLTCLK